MNWTTALTTAPRPEPTLDVTLASLALAGWDDVLVAAEPESSVPHGVVRQVVHSNRQGPYLNFLAALALAIEADPQADMVAVFQDDIELAAGLRRWLDATLWPWCPSGSGVLSLYCAATHERRTAGWFALPADDLPRKAYGALAYAMTMSTARRLLIEARRGVGRNMTDHWVGEWCRRANVPYHLHSPSLVRHTGETSTLTLFRKRNGDDLHERLFRQCGRFVSDVDELIERD